MKTFLQKHLDDLLYVAGGALWVHATWQLNPIAAEYVAGVFCLVSCVLVGIGASKR